MTDVWCFVYIVKSILIYFGFVAIILIMIYGDSYYYTLMYNIYSHSVFYKLNNILHLSNNWKHFGGPAGCNDTVVGAIIEQDGVEYDVILYDPSKNIAWKNRKANVLDGKWFEYVKNMNEDCVEATYGYLERMYSNASNIKITVSNKKMKGFHAEKEGDGWFVNFIDRPSEKDKDV